MKNRSLAPPEGKDLKCGYDDLNDNPEYQQTLKKLEQGMTAAQAAAIRARVRIWQPAKAPVIPRQSIGHYCN